MSADFPYKNRCYDFSVLSRLSYKEFCKENKDIKLKKNEYDTILRTYGEVIADRIIETGEGYKPPLAFPEIHISKYKPKKYIDKNGEIRQRRSIDWQKSRQYGKRIYTLNSHTDGYIVIVTRNKTTGNINLNDYWSFKGVRYSNRTLASKLKSSERYKLLENYREIIMLKNDI